MSRDNVFRVPALTSIGYFGKPHGVRGEIVAYLNVDLHTLCWAISNRYIYIFVEIDSLPVPHKLVGWRSKGDSYLLTLAHIADRTSVERMTGARILLPTELLAESDVVYGWDHFVGYGVKNLQQQYVGEILDVNDQTENTLLVIVCPDGTQRYLPIHEDLVESVDPKHRIIELHIPEGLLDL